jgi:glycosyltransferase involved in cell wall biosynthesis
MIKVANIIEDSRYGGPQNRIINVADKLKQYNITTVIICPEQESHKFYTEAKKGGIQIERIPMSRLSKNAFSVFRYFIFLTTEVIILRRLLLKQNIDIVHCNSARQFKGVIAAKLAGKKVVWHLNDTWNPLVIRLIFYPLAFMAEYFIAAGNRVRSYYLDSFLSKRKPVRIIRPPVETTIFDPKKVEVDLRITESQGIKIVSVGNINPAKGFEYLIEAVAYFKKVSVFSVWIVGPYYENQKTYYNHLEKLTVEHANGCLHFYGPSDDIPAILKAGDIFVCSSIHESGPMSVWESMAMGKAIVSTDVGDVNKFIEDGINGFIVPPRDPKALAEKIEILCEDAQLRKDFGRRARETAIRHLDISVCAKKHADVYRAVLQKP